jgi:hypothetical protein
MKLEVKIKQDVKKILPGNWLYYIAYDRGSVPIDVNKVMNFEFHKMLKVCELLVKNSSSLI